MTLFQDVGLLAQSLTFFGCVSMQYGSHEMSYFEIFVTQPTNLLPPGHPCQSMTTSTTLWDLPGARHANYPIHAADTVLILSQSLL